MAFVNVNVLPMDRERVLLNQIVVIERGLITALGPANQVQVPAGAVRIDGRGKYLIPGLGDMHVHNHPRDIQGDTYEKVASRLVPHVADGITTLRYLAEGGGVSVHQAQLFKQAEVRGPRIYSPGVFVHHRGVSSVKDSGRKLERSDSMTAYVSAAKAAGYHLIDVSPAVVYARQGVPAIVSLFAAARRLDLRVAAHDHETSFAKTLSIGAYGGSTEHLGWFRDTLGFRSGEYSDTLGSQRADLLRAKIPALAAAAARAGLWVTPTLHCTEAKYGAPPAQIMLLRQMVKSLQEAGAGLLLGGDENGNVHDELAALVRAGLSPYQALLTGTRNVAQYFGLVDSSGTVAVGKRADLVLLYSNPFMDIRHTREPAGVMLHGQWLDRTTLDQQLLAVKTSGWPKTWLRSGLRDGRIIPRDSNRLPAPPRDEQREKLKIHLETFEALRDSLKVVQSLGQDGASASQRLRQRLTEELGAMRGVLTPEQHVVFDPLARVWLREQARQGHPVAIPGIARIP